MSYKKIPEQKKLCGLHGAHVEMSVFNDFGGCRCLMCNGAMCHSCGVLEQMQYDILQHGISRCQQCLGTTKQR